LPEKTFELFDNVIIVVIGPSKYRLIYEHHRSGIHNIATLPELLVVHSAPLKWENAIVGSQYNVHFLAM
jgi:hypothetical protein